MRPVMEMRAQLNLEKENLLLGMNLYKLGDLLVDIVQTSIGIAQFMRSPSPLK